MERGGRGRSLALLLLLLSVSSLLAALEVRRRRTMTCLGLHFLLCAHIDDNDNSVL